MSWLGRFLDRRGRGGGGAWASEGEEHRADEQRADTSGLEVEGDPRGGLQDERYRSSDPRDVVEAEGVAMSGPGGAPQEDTTPDERREQQR